MLIFLIAMAVVAILIYSIALGWQRFWGRKRTPDTLRQREIPTIVFYQRLESLLRRHKMVRTASQTPREFAMVVGGQLAESTATQPAMSLPRRVVEAFYRVRFGRQALDNLEAEAVEQAITELDLVLQQAQAAQANSRRRGS